jgi:hypothetical protein
MTTYPLGRDQSIRMEMAMVAPCDEHEEERRQEQNQNGGPRMLSETLAGARGMDRNEASTLSNSKTTLGGVQNETQVI